MRTSTACGLVVLASLVPTLAHAAEMTDVADAFDMAHNNPIDFRFEPSFRSESSSGVISRENVCTPKESCAATVFNRELEFARSMSILDTTLKLGVGMNFELHGRLPVVFGDRTNLKFANDVNGSNSRVDPSDDKVSADLADGDFFSSYQFFDVETEGDGIKRSGTGDPTLGFAWSPLESTEEEPWGTLVFGFDYTLPMAEIRTADNDAVGRGVHNFAFLLASSRPVGAIEPFFTFQFDLPLPATNSPYRDISSDQSLVGPGPKFETTLGTEVTMFKDAASKQSYTLGLGMRYGYQFAGRDWTPLSDAFANSGCNDLTPKDVGMLNPGDLTGGPDGNAYNPVSGTSPDLARCGWVVQAPGNAVGLDNPAAATSETKFAYDGLSDVEGFGLVGGNIALNLQFSEWAELRIKSDVVYETSHFLTNANSGKSSEADGTVELDPAKGERNPFYNTAIDAQGSRFRSDGVLRVNWAATFAILL
jgi:hypothetical protein